ncbi:MAG: hypothetical protein P4M15_10535 [Alphaproteobacteria bacterium]|nr:hypothetical protein [Alphaproteobacteria bacterium]
MSDAIEIKRASFWREAWGEIKSSVKAQMVWLVGYAVLMIGAILIGTWGVDLNAAVADKGFFQQHPQALSQILIGQTVRMLLSILSGYFFAVLYLRSVKKSNPPVLGFEGFFYWLGQSCIVFFLGVIFIAALAALIMLAWTILPKDGMGMTLKGLAVAAGVVALYWLVLRFSLLAPAAVLHHAPAWKNCWAITEGKCYRILGGLLMIMLILAGIFLLPAVISVVLKMQFGASSPVTTLFRAFYMGIATSFVSYAFMVYFCTVYRILLHEKQNASSIVTP